MVVTGDAAGQVTVGHCRQHVHRFGNRLDDRVQRTIDTLNDAAEIALVPRDVRPGVQFADQRTVTDLGGVFDEREDIGAQLLDVLIDKGFFCPGIAPVTPPDRLRRTREYRPWLSS